MPQYTYLCTSCQAYFEKQSFICDYQEKEICPQCDSLKHVIRALGYDISTIHRNVRMGDDEVNLQQRAERNTKNMSRDEKIDKYYEQNKYKYEGPDADLPKGATRIVKKDKDSVMKRIEKKF